MIPLFSVLKDEIFYFLRITFAIEIFIIWSRVLHSCCFWEGSDGCGKEHTQSGWLLAALGALGAGHPHAPPLCPAVCDPSCPQDGWPHEWAGVKSARSIPRPVSDGAGRGHAYQDSPSKRQVLFRARLSTVCHSPGVVSMWMGAKGRPTGGLGMLAW